jgi:hypothetical protein
MIYIARRSFDVLPHPFTIFTISSFTNLSLIFVIIASRPLFLLSSNVVPSSVIVGSLSVVLNTLSFFTRSI